MMRRGNVYQCAQRMPGGCNRSIRSGDLTNLVEEALLATFEQSCHERRGTSRSC